MKWRQLNWKRKEKIFEENAIDTTKIIIENHVTDEVDFIGVENSFEEKYNLKIFIAPNCEPEKIQNPNIVKFCGVNKCNEGNYDSLFLGDYLSNFNEENQGADRYEWVNMIEFFDREELAADLYTKYKFRLLPRV